MKRKRGNNFSTDDKEEFLKLLYFYRDTLLNKSTDSGTNQAKHEDWVSLTNKFNAIRKCNRTKESLKKLWENIKTDAKTYRSPTKKYAGGSSFAKKNPIFSKLIDRLSSGCTGFENVEEFDSNISIKASPVDPSFHEEIDDVELQNDESNRQKKDANEPLPVKLVRLDETPSVSNSRRRMRPIRLPQSSKTTEKPESLPPASSGRNNEIDNQNLGIEDLRKKLLEEEIQFKRQLYNLHLQAAEKDVEIKNEILKQVKAGKLSWQDYAQQPK